MMEIITLARLGEKAAGVTRAFYKTAMYLKLLPLIPKIKWSADG
jgi:hypothetical protein